RDLAALARDLHARGAYLIARIVVFKDDPLAAARPDLAVKRANGQVFRDRERLAWVDPFQPEVRAYDIALALEAARAGFDEIQFDYLRFPDSSATLLLAQPSTTETRTAAIAGFLAEARRALAPYNVYLAADIFGYTCWNRNDTGIGQEIEAIAPNVDYLAPMLYPSGFQFGIPGVRRPVDNVYAIVHDSLGEAQARLKVSPRRFRPWLQAFRDYAFGGRLFDADEVAQQIKAAEDFGADGWMLWNAGNVYSGTGLAAAPSSPRAAGSSSGGSCP
ncbi:MAG TPA: putative glycoside hydrolase, partial [Caulobacteraceae bacterium]|nr:putative glycoside hydrolase [Caulobacteraceae bacterium]